MTSDPGSPTLPQLVWTNLLSLFRTCGRSTISVTTSIRACMALAEVDDGRV